MAKFDKNMKNAYLDDDELYEDYDEELEDSGYDEDDEEDYREELESDGTEDEIASPDTEEGEPAEEDEIPEEEAPAEPEGPKALWYVAHTYSGHENKVKINIEKIVENRGMQDLIQSVVVPTEDVVEVKDGQRKVKTRKMFPGYVLVKMIHTSETWYLIRNTQGVTGFVGHGSDPIPLTDDEVRRMGIEKVTYEIDTEIGDTVKITQGPFTGYLGLVEEVNLKKQTLKVKIRETSVEIGFDKVEKVL